MALDLDSYFGIHRKALQVWEQRSSQIANNLANVNTPNYKARDIDFKEALSGAMGSDSQLKVDSPNHIQVADANFSNQTKYRIPSHVSLDGNTVDKDIETAEFAHNALNYQASLSFLDGKIKSMLTALRGE